MKRISPKQAIDRECRWCMNDFNAGCRDNACPLKNAKLTVLKRIRSYCLQCVPEQDAAGVKKCTGEILSPEFHICTLHPHRLGNKKK